MIHRLFNQASKSIASGAVVLGLAGLLSRLLGVYRDRLLATTFGAGESLDIYYAAFRIPDFVFSLLVLGALSAGFIPVFSQYLKKNKEEAWRLAESVFFLLLATLITLCAVVFAFADYLIPLITPGFNQDQLVQTVLLTRIMLASPILLGASAVFGGVLQSFKRFLAYSLAPILYNLGIIFGIFFLVEPFGLSGLAYGVVLGAAIHLFMQGTIAMKLGFTWSFKHIWKQKGLKEIISLMGPRTISLVIFQVNLLVITIFATGLDEGSLTIFHFASNLAHVPIGLFGISFAVSAFPVLSEYIAENKVSEFAYTIYKTTSQILFFLIPTIVLFVLLDEQIVRLVYGAGEFTWDSTLTTAKTLLYFVPGLFAQALIPLFARGFYARKDTMQPLYASLIGLVATIGFSFWFIQLFEESVAGLAFAYSIASFLQLLILIALLKIKTDDEIRCLRQTIWQTIVASLGMIFVIQFIKSVSGPLLNLLTVKGVFIHFLLPTVIGGIVYLFILRFIENEEYLYYEQGIKGKLRLFEKAFVPTVATGEEDDTTL